MAYSYQLNMFDGSSEGYVKYNISPAFSVNMGLGDTFTISGQAYWRDSAVKSITVELGTGRDDYGFPTGTVTVGVVNKSISKAKTGTFSVTCTIPQALINKGVAGSNGMFSGFIGFSLWDAVDGIGSGSGTFGNASQKFNIIKARVTPTVNSVTLSDRHSAISGTMTPYQFFGGFIQSESLPRFSISFATDSRDTKLTATHSLVIVDGNNSTIYSLSATTAAQAVSVIFNLTAPAIAGTLYYTYTITDSAGLTATSTGSISVLAYTLPSISSFLLERYKYVTGEGNVAADDGENLWVTLGGSVSAVAGKNAWSLKLTYGVLDSGSTTDSQITDDSDGRSFSYARDDSVFSAIISATNTYEITAILKDMMNTVQVSLIVLKAGGYVDLEKYGFAVGMRTTATPTDKKFEVAEDYTAHFHGGIAATEEYTPEMLTGVDTPGSLGGSLVFRRVGSMVFINGTIKFTAAATTREICDVPDSFMPSDRITWIAAVTGSRVARLYINRRAADNTGVLVLEWVKTVSSTSSVSEAFVWVDCGYTYWAG